MIDGTEKKKWKYNNMGVNFRSIEVVEVEASCASKRNDRVWGRKTRDEMQSANTNTNSNRKGKGRKGKCSFLFCLCFVLFWALLCCAGHCWLPTSSTLHSQDSSLFPWQQPHLIDASLFFPFFFPFFLLYLFIVWWFTFI